MVGGYIYEVGEEWVAGIDWGEGDEVGWEVSVAWEEMNIFVKILLAVELTS